MRFIPAAFTILFSGCIWARAEDVGKELSVALQPQPLSTHAEWNQGFLKCEPQNSRDSRPYVPDLGWAIIDTSKSPVVVNNGDGGIDLVAGGHPFPGIATVTSQFDLLLAIARARSNTNAVQEIRSTRDAWLKAREGLPQYNAANYYVWANSHGSCQDQKGGSAAFNFSARIRFVGREEDLTNTINSLRAKHFPDI